ncbi:MAG: hypothetical protein LBL09_01375 [Oscillospiraceae bacterium]|jgi:hypothetical protein|nr:hypothetical protein [Oscillospiraceae bacterium]
MAEEKRKMTFGYWMKNVFVPHYLLITVIAVIGVAMAVYLLHDAYSGNRPDFILSVGTIDILTQDDLAELKSVIEETVGDVNGDGEVIVRVDVYTPTLDSSELEGIAADTETGTIQLQALDMAFMADADKVLFLFDETLRGRFEADNYESLADFGIASDTDPFYYVNDLPVFERILVVDTGYYLCVKGWRYDKKDDGKYIERYASAVKVINSLTAAE